MEPTALAELAEEIARAAGAVLLDFARRPLAVETKSTSTDMVSEADRAAEELIRERILRARPADAILGEEGGESGGTSGLRWVVDPLDGTTNYLYGLPAWAVSIAVEEPGGTRLAGCVHDPSRGETFTAARGAGAYLDGARIRPSDQADLARALVATGFAYDAPTRTAQAELVGRLIGEVRDVRRVGSAAIDLCWTACGRYDAYYERSLNPWDVAAGSLIVEEAGGVVRELEAVYADGPALHLVASGPALFAPLVRALGAPPPAVG